MTHKEALTLALEALKRNMEAGLTGIKIDEAIIAIKEALAQPEKPQPDRITTLRQLTENHSVDCLCADCVELDDIEEALAQPEQDPVAHVCVFPLRGDEFFPQTRIEWKNGRPVAGPLYTTPPQRTWVGLTEEDMDWLHANTPCIEGNYGYRFIRAIEAKLKEKNA